MTSKSVRVDRPKLTALRRGFYNEPYLTCTYCNHIMFLDVNQFHYLVSLKIQKRLDETTEFIPRRLQNQLLPCENCRHVDGYAFGAHDFSKELEKLKRLRAERILLEKRAATRIVRFYRRYLKRKYRRAVAGAKFTRKLLRSQAAIRIQSLARGRLGRRIYQTEKHIAFIKNSHPLLLRHALRFIPDQPRVFWYRRPVELELVYKNYLELVEKTGHQPPRIIVEKNMAMLAERIFLRQSELVIIIQKKWRGFVARRIVKFFKTEVFRLFSFEVAQVLRIQRNYRGHFVRMYVIPRLLDARLKQTILHQYQDEKYKEKLKKVSAKLKDHLKLSYLKEKRSAQAACLLSKLSYQFDSDAPPPPLRKLIGITGEGKRSRPTSSQAGHRHNYKFHESMYGDNQCMQRSIKVLQADMDVTMLKFHQEVEDRERREFIKERIVEKGPEGYGLRGVVLSPTSYQLTKETMKTKHSASSSSTINSAYTSSSRNKSKHESSRSHGMREYFTQDLEDLKDRALERITNPAEESCIHSLERHGKKKTRVQQEIKLFNQDKYMQQKSMKDKGRSITRTSSQFSFPDHVSFNAQEWLYSHDEDI